MAHYRVSDSFRTIKLSMQQYDDLLENMDRANALIRVLTSTDTDIHDSITLSHYLGTLEDLIYQAGEICHLFRQTSSSAETIAPVVK